MVKRSKGTMVNTRQVLKKKPRNRGSPPVTRFLQTFEVGDKANIVIESSSQKGQPHHRYHGRVGTIIRSQGNAYVVRVEEERLNKDLIIRPEHLRPIK
ncbi:MAG: 50S ribosomal protein L21e [Candidatus Thermoplasmatota archaeon]|nr:50S ribosomal protein L21e [Candidatus Thermoplasmatota archaeon]